MTQATPSVDEIVASLKNTSLPTVLVEGRDDMTTYRWIENRLGIQNANVLPCGGRDKLFAVYNRQTEFRHLKCAFLADRDMWLFDTTCSQYGSIVFTKGYSIENDILDDSHVADLLSPQRKRHSETLPPPCRNGLHLRFRSIAPEGHTWSMCILIK